MPARFSFSLYDLNPAAFNDATLPNPPAGTAPASFDDIIQINLLVHEMNLASRGDGPFRWLVGGFVSASEEATVDLLQSAGGASPTPAYREDRKDALNAWVRERLNDAATVASFPSVIERIRARPP